MSALTRSTRWSLTRQRVSGSAGQWIPQVSRTGETDRWTHASVKAGKEKGKRTLCLRVKMGQKGTGGSVSAHHGVVGVCFVLLAEKRPNEFSGLHVNAMEGTRRFQRKRAGWCTGGFIISTETKSRLDLIRLR